MTPLIHIGFHKTGSTWLQRQIFQPDMGFDPIISQTDIDGLVVQPHCLEFVPAKAKEATRTAKENLIPVISSENLSGHPFFGGRDSAVFAHRLRATWPNATILVVVRSQRTILPSVYMQYLKRGGLAPPKAFFAGSDGVNYPGFDPRHFEYDRLIRLYQGLFKRVVVVTYETLAQDPERFSNTIRDAVGRTPLRLPGDRVKSTSPSPSTGAATLIRTSNRVRRSTLNPSPLFTVTKEGGGIDKLISAIGRRLPKSAALSEMIEKELAPLYTKSNARLAQLFPELDLTAYP